ncbi:MAG: amidase [Pseudomonadales bacterium]
MITLEEYTSRDATALAELVRSGELQPGELIDAAIRAIDAVNGDVNAVLQVLAHEAHAGARTLDLRAPFCGVPFGIKELVLQAKGVTLDMGSALARGFRPAADTELMRRFREAGLLLVATTQTPEFGYNPTTETVLHGPVHNPWDPGRSAGGSSGGSGAAVASGMLPLAHANDGGGSIRIPGCCNGLVGLKPTRDRIPTGPDASDPLFGLAIEFAVTRSVRDAARLLDAVAGPDAGAPSFCVPPPRPYAQEMGAEVGRLRVAYSSRAPSGAESAPECREAVERTVRTLADMGHDVVEAAPVFDWDRFLETVHVLWCVGTAFPMDSVAQALGRTPSPDNVEATTWACYEDGKRISTAELLSAEAHHNAVRRQVAPFFESYDLFVTPTLAGPAAPLGQMNQNRAGLSAMDWTRQVFAYCPFTPLFNTTGQPAISLPLHETATGLPIGVQLVAPFSDESLLFRVASALEEAMPWADRRPRLHAAGRGG